MSTERMLTAGYAVLLGVAALAICAWLCIETRRERRAHLTKGGRS